MKAKDSYFLRTILKIFTVIFVAGLLGCGGGSGGTGAEFGGSVKSAATAKPVPGVSVTISETGDSGFTDSEGNYRVHSRIPANGKVTFSFVGKVDGTDVSTSVPLSQQLDPIKTTSVQADWAIDPTVNDVALIGIPVIKEKGGTQDAGSNSAHTTNNQAGETSDISTASNSTSSNAASDFDADGGAASDPAGTGDIPVILSARILAANGLSQGQGGTATLQVVAKSKSQINWINFNYNSSTTMLLGGGAGVTFTNCKNLQQNPNHLCAGLGTDSWYYEQTFAITQYAQNGTYSIQRLSVKNGAFATSARYGLPLTFEVAGNPVSNPPEIVSASLQLSGGLTQGAGGTALLRVVAKSDARVDFLSLMLQGPTSILEGGGSGVTFARCINLQVNANHPCSGLTDNSYWYYERPYHFTSNSENGYYSFNSIRVSDASSQQSNIYSGTVDFQIAGNVVAEVPVITNIQLVYSDSFGPSNLTQGVNINNGCLVRSSAPSPLWLSLIITANSNVPVNWINSSFNGPAGNIYGGGNGLSSYQISQIGPNQWQVYNPAPLYNPSSAPVGVYSFSGVSVMNEGNRTSGVYGGNLSFTLSDSCP